MHEFSVGKAFLDEIRTPPSAIFCLVAVAGDDGLPEEGLLLTPVGESEDIFRRIGQFRTWGSHTHGNTRGLDRQAWYADWYSSARTRTVTIM